MNVVVASYFLAILFAFIGAIIDELCENSTASVVFYLLALVLMFAFFVLSFIYIFFV